MKKATYSQVESFNSVKSGPEFLGGVYSDESEVTYEPGRKSKSRKKKIFKR
ncbi:hypothetical protein [uncultured Microscilla sp.]|uniref:Uncharacterized protein n=1 Tax=Microscilla marina ATCC 23134 TaxID=313606 RepID=A1ZWH2_MICM2|nr:hypothetical protein [uncultured Microscilla sp.]EAY25312.1 hypothetical protein M23134_02783 [Microscilla marina ATCC 23134]